MADTDATASFAMDLGIEGASDALSAADALERLQTKIQDGTDSIAGMQKALRLLKGDTVGNAASITTLKDKITAQRATVASATADYVKLGGEFKKTKKAADESSESFLRDIVTGNLLAAAIKNVASAAVDAAKALVSFGLSAVDTRRSEELQLEGLTKLRFGWLGLYGGYQMAADKASFLQSTIDKVSASVSIGRDQVVGYTTQLYKMGYRAGNLQAALEGISMAASGGGETAAKQFLAMADNARYAGGSIRKLADDTKARFGGIVARQMLSLDVQGKKLKENFRFLFSGVKVEHFLEGLNKVTELFSANTEAGKALQEIITTIFSPIFDTAGDAGEGLAGVFKRGELAVLDFMIALYPLRKTIHNFFADVDEEGWADALKRASIKATIALGAGVLDMIGLLVKGVWYGANVVVNIIGEAVIGVGKDLLSLGGIALRAGISVAQGIGEGIAAGAHWAIEAISNLGKDVLKKFRAVFDIHSPSRVMRKDAINISRGAAQGVDDGVPEVQRAVGRARPDFVGAADAEGAKAQANEAKGAGSSGPLITGGLHLHTSEKLPEKMIEDFTTQLLQKLQGAAIQMGARV